MVIVMSACAARPRPSMGECDGSCIYKRGAGIPRGSKKFLHDNAPAEMRRKLVEGRHVSKEEMVSWWRILNKNGWSVGKWPREHGGAGWKPVQHYIFIEELQMYPARFRSPSASPWSVR